MKWAFGVVLVVVTGAVAAFAIYTWGWREKPETVETIATVTQPTSGNKGWHWSEGLAESKLEHSRWGVDMGVDLADCQGEGPYTRDEGDELLYQRFACTYLPDDPDKGEGLVDVRVTGRDTFKVTPK